MQLPALAVTALIPFILTWGPPSNDDPFGNDHPEHRQYCLAVKARNEAHGDEAENKRKGIPLGLEKHWEVNAELPEALCSGNRAYGPVCGRKACNCDVNGKDHDVRKNEEVGFAFVVGPTERCCRITLRIRFLGAFVETDGLAPFFVDSQ